MRRAFTFLAAIGLAGGCALQAKLGATDRQRMEQHLDGLRAIENRLEALGQEGGENGVAHRRVSVTISDIEA